MKKVLFVCTGNTCRSPMAQEIFNSLCRERGLAYEAESAGVCTVTGLAMSENSLEALREWGIESEGFTSTSLDELRLEDFELIAVMSENHKRVLTEVFGADENKIRVMNVADPYGSGIGIYRLCRDEIVQGVNMIIEELGDEDESRDT